MAEIALHVADLGFLRRQGRLLESHRVAELNSPPAPLEMERAGWKKVVELVHDPVQRLYLSSEFCPFLAMRETELTEAMALAEKKSLAATVVLAPLGQHALDRTLPVLDRLASRFGRYECVVNDWGTLQALHHLPVVPVLGRLLFKVKRLPRFNEQTRPAAVRAVSEETGEIATSEQVLAAQMRELAFFPPDSERMAAMAAGLGAERLDCEVVPQGVSLGKAPRMKASLHVPFTYVTGGGICPVARVTQQGSDFVCARRCRQTFILPRYPSKTWPMKQIGHTVFASMLPLMKHYLSLGRFDRVIVEPVIPM